MFAASVLNWRLIEQEAMWQVSGEINAIESKDYASESLATAHDADFITFLQRISNASTTN